MKPRWLYILGALSLGAIILVLNPFREKGRSSPAFNPSHDIERLPARLATAPAPTLANLPALLPPVDTNAAPSSGPVNTAPPPSFLSEENRAELRRTFSPPRFVTDTTIPRTRQTPLSNRLLITSEDRSIVEKPSGGQTPTTRGTTPFIVQFSTPVSSESRALLTAQGGITHGFFPHNSILAELTPEALRSLGSAEPIHAIAEYLPSDKVQPFLTFLRASHKAENQVPVLIQTFAIQDTGVVELTIKEHGGAIERVTRSSERGVVRAVLPLSAIPTLSTLGEVQWIEEAPLLKTRNNYASITTHLNVQPLWDTYGLSGKGQVVGHADTGLDTGNTNTLHIDLRGRVRALIARGRPGDSSDTHGHGTHTAGSIAGSGAASNGRIRGMAWESELVHQSVLDSKGGLSGIPDDLTELFAESFALGAHLHSDSWGAETYGAYTIMESRTDLFAWEHPTHLAIVAAGNAGRDSNSSGVTDLASVGSPATAKNVVAVGATENDRAQASGGFTGISWGGQWPNLFPADPIRTDLISYSATTNPYTQGMAAFSSRGPTYDGRVKPDVVAPGTDVISTKSYLGGNGLWGLYLDYQAYRFSGGTSMATPLVAGCAALLRQYAQERAMVPEPSAALLKAMLVGGARSLSPGQYGTGAFREIPAESPNQVEGWGQPDLEATLFPTNMGALLLDRCCPARAGETNTFHITVIEPGYPLDVALTWIDYPANPGTLYTLVNNLDLSLEATGGSVTLPNGLNEPDDLNSVEVIRLPAADAGEYSIHVAATAMPYEGGVAALYVRGALAPSLSHTPRLSLSQGNALEAEFDVQPLGVLEQRSGSASLYWAAGDAAGPTSAWSRIAANLVTNVRYTAEIPALPAGVVLHYYFETELDGPTFTRLPRSAPAMFFSIPVDEEVDLVVSGSPHEIGAVTPPYGTNQVVANAPFAVSAPPFVDGAPGYRDLCCGWWGSGDIRSRTNTTQAMLEIGETSSLTWLWQAQYALTNHYRLLDTGQYFGTVVTWHDTNTLVSTEQAIELGLVGDVPYAFCGWKVDDERWPASTGHSPNPATNIPLEKPRTALGEYLPFWQDSDDNLLSDWWELRYFGSITNSLASGDDPDRDGWTNLAEFLDNSDPHNPESTPIPPFITMHPLHPFQSAHPPWNLDVAITDNFTVEAAWLVWRERDESNWRTNTLSHLEGDTYRVALNPPSHGAKRVDYFVVAADLLGYYQDSFRSVSPTNSVIGDYDFPWMETAPANLGVCELGATGANLSFEVTNLAGPDLCWTARVARGSAPFLATNVSWRHSGRNDAWCVTTNRTWNSDPVWYCGNPATRRYPDNCHAKLDTPEFQVGHGGGLLWHQWIQSEFDEGNSYWDGAVVRISRDGGTTFELITPYGGYPHQVAPNPVSPFPYNHPCMGGDGDGWRTMLLDLKPYEGESVVVRFEFGSDGLSNREGWYVANATPFSLDSPVPAWLEQRGSWQGILPDGWSAQPEAEIYPEHIALHTEVAACIRVEGNTPDIALMPLCVRRGLVVNTSANGPGALAAAPAFLFRNDSTAISLQADPGCYLCAVTVNQTPLLDEYHYGVESRVVELTRIINDLEVVGWFAPRMWELTIQSGHSLTTPAVGTYSLAENTVVEASVFSPTNLSESIRLQSKGWTLTGHTPSNGVADAFSFTITNNATLVWQWEYAFRLLAQAGAHGSLSPVNSWHTYATWVEVLAQPDPYFHLAEWSGDLNDAIYESNKVRVVITCPRTINATFAPNLTPTHGVPEYWLAAYGWTEGFESAAEADQDGDGVPTWQEWLADTDPTDTDSRLAFTGITRKPGSVRLKWKGGVWRTQEVQRASSPAGPWSVLHTNLPPTPITNHLWFGVESNSFYRLFIPAP